MELHNNFQDIVMSLYDRCNIMYSSFIKESHSAEYSAYSGKVNNFNICFRTAKITPKKVGQFVAIWKRIGTGPTQPHDAQDTLDFIVILTKKDNKIGQFVFPKSVLIQKNILSKNNIGGKRGIRVYPSWDVTTNSQAKKTQAWQLKYFFIFSKESSIDCNLVNQLYCHM